MNDELSKLPTDKSKWIPIPDNQRKRPGYNPDAKPLEPPTVKEWAEKTLEDIVKKTK